MKTDLFLVYDYGNLTLPSTGKDNCFASPCDEPPCDCDCDFDHCDECDCDVCDNDGCETCDYYEE